MENSPLIFKRHAETGATGELQNETKAGSSDMDPFRVLIVEDEKAHFQLMRRALLKELPEALVCHALNATECLDTLESIQPDIILVDYLLPGMNGIEFLGHIKQMRSDIPVIMITGQGDERIAVQAMKLGAQDYLVKSADFFLLLPAVVGQAVRERRLKLNLRKVARLNELLLDSLPYPAMLIRQDRSVIAANRIAQAFGAQVGSYCWKRFRIGAHTELQCNEEGACSFCRSNDAFAAGKAVYAQEIAANGRFWDIWWIPIDREASLTYAIDITERKKVEGTLRKSEERFRKIFENAATGIAIADSEGRFKQCNRAYCALLGYTDKELRQIKFSSVIHPQDRTANLSEINRLVTGKMQFFEMENRYVHKNGQAIWVQKHVSLLPGESGEPPYILELVSDTTKSKQAKELVDNLNKSLVERTKLAEQRAMHIQQLAMELSGAEDRERHRLAGILHDDFQQMLAYLKLKLSALPAKDTSGDELSALNKVISDCINRCRNLAHELKPFASKQTDFLDALKTLCRQMLDMYGLEVTLQTDAHLHIQSSVLCSLLIRSIRELLFNTVKHSGVTTAAITVQLQDKHMQIVIKDMGKGCEPSRLKERMDNHDAFGLFNIKDRLNFLGGHMQVESAPGKGFWARLWVPIDACSPPQKLQPTPDGYLPIGLQADKSENASVDLKK